ncbi:MAG: hypothetical protein DDT29_01580 [Dehalococcoidia bacterium]|nr:hypothetical protein [Bacillota bacterium]
MIDLPGFREGTVITVRLRMVDLTPRLMTLKIGNLLLAEAQKLAKDGLGREEIAARLDGGDQMHEMLLLLDDVAKEALVEPSHGEIIAIQPLSLAQKLKIFECAAGLGDLQPFRGE